MKQRIFLIIACVVFALLVAGCTSQPATPATPTATPSPTETMAVITPPAPIIDPDLLGTWTLKEIALQGGSAPLVVFNSPITATFDNQGNLGGNGGCNGYSSQYTLSGGVNAFGKDISIGPIISTMMYCESTSNMETQYLQVLQEVTSYSVVNPTTLTMRDNLGSVLTFTQ
jgi:heat shock protein HslJ